MCIRDRYLGWRECQAYVEPCIFNEGIGAYDDIGELSFGMMFHGFTYADEAIHEMCIRDRCNRSKDNGSGRDFDLSIFVCYYNILHVIFTIRFREILSEVCASGFFAGQCAGGNQFSERNQAFNL